MREYSKVSSAFWTGETGIKMRKAGPTTQLVALHLLTCRLSNMIGLYYLPVPMIAHDLGITLDAAQKALARVVEAGFASYEAANSLVWVPEMAKYQIGETLQASDNRVKGIVRTLEPFRKSKFYLAFHAKYGVAYNLPSPRVPQAPSEMSPSQEQEQEQEQEQDTPLPPKGGEVADFDAFWKAYPRHVDKETAERGWNRLGPDATLLATILAAIEAQKLRGCLQPRSVDGRSVIPYPASWLNRKRWTDELDPVADGNGELYPTEEEIARKAEQNRRDNQRHSR